MLTYSDLLKATFTIEFYMIPHLQSFFKVIFNRYKFQSNMILNCYYYLNYTKVAKQINRSSKKSERPFFLFSGQTLFYRIGSWLTFWAHTEGYQDG
jgi:hypothetical protein